MRKFTPAQLQYLHPGGRGRPAAPAQITVESKARGARRRRIEAIGDERKRTSELNHFGDDPAEEL